MMSHCDIETKCQQYGIRKNFAIITQRFLYDLANAFLNIFLRFFPKKFQEYPKNIFLRTYYTML